MCAADLTEIDEAEIDREALFERNKALVYHMYRRLHLAGAARRVHPDDAIQEGMIALFLASQGWNPAEGVQFSSYACVAIERRILRAANRARPDGLTVSLDALEGAVQLPAPGHTRRDRELAAVRDVVEGVLWTLPVRDHYLVRRAFGIEVERADQRDIGAGLGIGRAGVSARLKRVMERLRKAMGEGR